MAHRKIEKPTSTRQTNAQFAKSNKDFCEHCEKAKVGVSARQAGKYRNHRGAAFAQKGK
jgi:hypothetical protein